jgi:hypothetical protein
MPSWRRCVPVLLAMLGAVGTLTGLRLTHFHVGRASAPRVVPQGISPLPPSPPRAVSRATPSPLPPPPLRNAAAAAATPAAAAGHEQACVAGNGGRAAISLRMGYPGEASRSLGDIRLVLRPEWSSPSASYAEKVSTAPASKQDSNVYRLEPGFLIQGRLASGGVPTNRDKRRAPKVMERGEVGWAGGGAGPCVHTASTLCHRRRRSHRRRS